MVILWYFTVLMFFFTPLLRSNYKEAYQVPLTANNLRSGVAVCSSSTMCSSSSCSRTSFVIYALFAEPFLTTNIRAECKHCLQPLWLLTSLDVTAASYFDHSPWKACFPGDRWVCVCVCVYLLYLNMNISKEIRNQQVTTDRVQIFFLKMGESCLQSGFKWGSTAAHEDSSGKSSLMAQPRDRPAPYGRCTMERGKLRVRGRTITIAQINFFLLLLSVRSNLF